MEANTCKFFLKSAIGDYVLKSRVAKSCLSVVWKAEHRLSGEEVILKQVYLSRLNLSLKDCLDCELKFLASVNHPNIIRLLDILQEDGCIFLVLEFCAGGTLASYIQRSGRVHEQVARNFAQQLGAGLENILLSTLDGDPILKISDFGFSRVVHPGAYAEAVCGSPLYMAPEVLQFQRYNEKVDMWSLGAILFELLNGYPPFCGKNNVQLLQNIKKCGHLPFSQLILPDLGADCVDMCTRLLCSNPANRLSFDEFIHHKFLR